MSSEHRASVSTALDLGLLAGAQPLAQLVQDSEAAVSGTQPAVNIHNPSAADIAVRSAKRLAHARVERHLPPNEFLSDMYREMRRAERTRGALSLVLYRVDDAHSQSSDKPDQLLEVLHSTKRETDILGHVADDMIAVLCPDTDAQGNERFRSKVDALTGGLPRAAVAATYPDAIFNDIAKGRAAPGNSEPFLAADASGGGPCGYPLKRSLDIGGAMLAICVFGPLMLLTAAVIALTSRGPVIFKQPRLGKGGVPFTFYKFRSMFVNGDDGIHKRFVAGLIAGDEAADSGAARRARTYKLQADPRITRFGRFIRKTSIDELPQFFNVLMGDMSLVGPRPPIPYETSHYQSWHLRRILNATPGITGLWQVGGRSKVSFNEMVRMDLRYLRECSLGLDLRILARTVLVVLKCDGAG